MERDRLKQGRGQLRYANGRLITNGLLWLVLAIASCNDDTVPGFSGQSVPVEVTTSLDAGIIETRAAVPLFEGCIGVFVGSANGYTPQYNIQYTFNIDIKQWEPASEPVFIGKANASLYAYYDPYRVVVFPANSTVTQSVLAAQKYDVKKLWFYATTGGSNVCKATPQAKFDMMMAYARLKLSIQRYATNYPGDCNITNVNIKSGADFLISGAFDISSGTLSGTPATEGFTYALNSGNIAAGNINTDYDVLLPPQGVASGLTITLTIDGVNRSVTIPAAQFTDSKLKAGNQYTVSLLIKDTEVTAIGTVQADDFGTGDTVTGTSSEIV